MLFLISAFVAAWLGSTVPASVECLVIPDDVQTRWNHATKVFVADVRAIDNSGFVVFDVLEGFKGVRPGTLALWVYSEFHGFRFQVGHRVLVYGNPSPGDPEVMSTSCSPTRLVTLDDKELVTLRRLARK